MPSQSESGGNGGGINHGRETDYGNYLSRILSLVVPVQELDMLGDNVIWILVLAEVALIERGRSTSREEWIPKFLLQLLDLSFKICDEDSLFLKSSRSDQVVTARWFLLGTLEELDACMPVMEGNLARRVTAAVTRASLPFHHPDWRKSLRSKRTDGRRREILLGA